jgi:Fe-S cluster assembly protein SufD
VFVDGRHRPELCDLGTLPAGVTVASLAAALEAPPPWLEAALAAVPAADGEALLAFNTAFMRDGALVRLEPGVRLETPLHLLFVAGPGAAERVLPLRNLILAGAGSSATVLESYVGIGGGRYWTSVVSHAVVGEGAAISHAKHQDEGSEAVHLAATGATLAEGSRYASFALSLGGRLARNGIAAALDGSGIDCDLSGAYLARGRQHLDTSTWIDHVGPGSTSREHYKGVLDESAHGVFQGRITVRPDAQQTDAHQLNKNLLLSDGAQVDTKPALEIHADDVKCSHGATVGELDAEALFYLRARGLDEALARRLLIEAFIADVVDQVEAAALRGYLKRAVLGWLPRQRD